ncbi:EAL domain-containing protein [Bradyrhizobium sp. U87765 SZCCT0131]|uniref:EAL domain-containing protein n=1 Tax=unclassified Bradyrhizobium TaxID=2631580 RepID=UPI001BA89124|nr:MULTISPECIES: EAL domain-containing protein [unclassified Bradyrhizobium]MBR1218686.1 EAL domain-containing protein [Bradyrhizobium sp. U87765 SZCCT0131]MBR1265555.1 EAL domain-containing protein [Bradyrhizobium sp. U87765 SZCCT0134]MBR1304184.1 EAL domain-containing protein [Bradyrhizobium sp. U87765 SZCCT0110]MBR1319790.1 EAL domain-containing protein [Bradyrhizobium sp. U87765 SZCCT0109]MBR1348115.1 EAL domain-containing protein [Bradyrhizobium sp. U87765 SZCCT0048]
MIRISTIFIAICMVLIAASLGFVLYALAGFSLPESAIIALATLTFLILYNAISMRMRDRATAATQVADLSRGTTDLARQVVEFGRRLAAVEQRAAAIDTAAQERAQSAMDEINELGALMKQLAVSVAAHDEQLAGGGRPAQRPEALQAARQAGDLEWVDAAPARPAGPPPIPAVAPRPVAVAPSHPQVLAAVRRAIDSNQIELYLQPLVTLPQRKVRFYEAVSRIRDDNDQLIPATDFIAAAESAGLMGQIDRMVLLRCVQVLRRLMVRNKDVGVFCNMSATTLGDPEAFAQCLDFLDANRALAPSFVLEFKQATLRALSPADGENLAALAQRGYRFSVDHVSDLRIEPRELADRGVRFIKVPASLLLDQKQMSASDIHPADLSDLLGRFGIELVAERIEGERAVVDLLDYDIRFGQGYLFAPPRPLRPEGAQANGAGETAPQPARAASADIRPEAARSEPARITGNAALVSRSRMR